MWNVYSLIKSGALKPIIWESSWDRAIREVEEQTMSFIKENCIDRIPKGLNELEKGLAQLTQTLDKDERWEIAHAIDQNSRMLSVYAIMGMQHPLIRNCYRKVSDALQKASNIFNKYLDLSLFSEFSKARGKDLTEAAQKYQPELIKTNNK